MFSSVGLRLSAAYGTRHVRRVAPCPAECWPRCTQSGYTGPRE